MSKQSPHTKRGVPNLGTIGIDEVGRGPFAGPVIVCAVYIEDKNKVLKELFNNTIRDSKNINKALRFNIFQTIRKKRYITTRIEYAVSSCSAQYIDKHGIMQAIRVCAKRCIESLRKKGVSVEEILIRTDAGLMIPDATLTQKSFIKGDEHYVEIALASIIAKEWRDAYMAKLAKIYPEYLWERNAGYGTKDHATAIREHGVTKYHRKSYLKVFKLFDKTE